MAKCWQNKMAHGTLCSVKKESLTNSTNPQNFVAHNVAVLMRDGSLLLASRSKQGTLTYTAACVCVCVCGKSNGDGWLHYEKCS